MGAGQQVFATLDPTTRRLRLGRGREVLMTDTVGFIQKLPTSLVAAFRATLEEVTHADLVLQVVDVSSPSAAAQAATVEEVLGQLEAAGKPRVVALNKVDLLGPAARRRTLQRLGELFPGAVPVSALQRSGLGGLQEALERASRPEAVRVELLVPYGREKVLAELRQLGGLERTEYAEGGTRAWGWAPRQALHRFEPYRRGG